MTAASGKATVAGRSDAPINAASADLADGVDALTADGAMPAKNGGLIVTADVPADIQVTQLSFDPHGTLTASGAAVAGWTATCETVQDALTATDVVTRSWLS